MASSSSTIETDVVSLLNRLEKELSNGAHSGAVEALEKLSRIPFTVALLAKTRAGVRAAKLRDHEHAGVMTSARECVRLWKKIAEESGARTKAAAAEVGVGVGSGLGVGLGVGVGSGLGVGVGSGLGAGLSALVAIADPGSSSASASASASASGSSATGSSATRPQTLLPPLPPARARVREGLGKVLEDVVAAYLVSAEGIEAVASGALPSKESDDMGGEARVVSGAIEAALFAALGGLNDAAPSDAYGAQFRSLFFNLKRNVPLSINTFWGFVTPAIVALLSAEELATEEAKKAAEGAASKGLESVMLDWKQKNRIAVLTAAGLSTALNGQPCKKCKSKNTDFTEKQMRSGDEPMSL